MRKKSIFIAATGQNVGKTTLCLGIISGLKKRFSSVGFIKPIGQQHVRIDETTNVDKDVILFKKHFSLPEPWPTMSPVIIPSGFTRDFLDGKFSEESMLEKIQSSFGEIFHSNDYTIVEGTGHAGVGSIVNLSNAVVASKLGTDVILIASGGLGSAHDELALNITLCQQQGVRVRGVILNRVLEEKRDMILHYFPKSLKKWNIPLIGCVPYNKLLSQPTIQDFANLFKTKLFSGEEYRYRHFQNMRLVADSVETYATTHSYNELIITPASREEIILCNIEKHKASKNQEFAGGMILTGYTPPSPAIIEKIQFLQIPALYAPVCSFDAMKLITSFTSKIRTEDQLKVEKAISIVEQHIDFNLLCCDSFYNHV
ncbi:MAG: AAA family ATPase [Parachlamydiaceae bacterium]|nr:AAA family ATPase [Parachlamydiaceae bacterium]